MRPKPAGECAAAALRITLGIFLRIAGWGGVLLNVLIWFPAFPPSFDPIIDGSHTVYTLLLLTLIWLHARNRCGLRRWWEAKSPPLLH
jgi:hypothetical protein